ncbi:Tripeptidyl-peptidase 2 [Picochlorum sp. SENEW3]|nr:Tripeptidyl-peptidase 2 [Picochlorum sp. SENEW3]
MIGALSAPGNWKRVNLQFKKQTVPYTPVYPSSYRQNRRRLRMEPSVAVAAGVGVGDEVDPTMSMTGDELVDVAWSSVVPKTEIQASAFLREHPEFDGRGVVIAIFDTGVDPGAPGLQETTCGEKKIIDVVDCTGSGDVDMSTIREADDDGCIEGVYGNTLKVHPDWKNPTNTWRVGSKRLYDLYPGGLKHRMKKERKVKFQEYHNVLETRACIDVSEKIEGDTEKEKKRKEELEARVDLLQTMYEKKYEDFGPSIDCVVWHDGEKWMAAIETTQLYEFFFDEADERGQLMDFEPLTNYRDCLRYGTFSALDACNFALNIYDEGCTLSIVVDAGSHGTHVAGISAGHFPEDSCLNGIAPGAKIVSCKIGDTRLGSMETMTGLSRAMTAVLENSCDLINMSYGEAASAPNAGRFVRLADEIVHKHGVIFVASAGNAGPALSTVGAPGGTSSSIMGIGAYVTPDLAKSGHSVRHPIESGAQYTWSSRGPTIDGDVGVSVSAPGGAITSVPQWTTQKKQLMNGTSMSSPCACGGLALLLSAMKSSGMKITPSLIRRAAENTAMPIKPDDQSSRLTYGHGLLQVKDGWDYLRQSQGTHLVDTLGDIRFDISVKRTDGHFSGRGVYLRDPADSKENRTFTVNVKPELHESADVRDHKLNIDLKLELSCSASWVVAPSMLMLHHNGRAFEIEVNCSSLGYGLHYAEIEAFESTDKAAGPLFKIPVCVIKPHLLEEGAGSLKLSTDYGLQMKGTTLSWNEKLFVPGMEDRQFVMVPHGATWAEMVIRPVEIETSMACMVRATSLVSHTRYSDTEYRSFVRLNHGMEHLASFPVVQGSTLELTIAQFWSSFGKNSISVDLTFHGVDVQPAKGHSFAANGSSWPLKAVIHAPFRSEPIKPSCKLDALSLFLRPSKADMKALPGPRNALPGNRTVHELVLSYDVTLAEGGKITPKIPAINNYVYDGELGGQITVVCDKNKRVIGVGDIYPEAMQVKKGDYTIFVCLRHEQPSFLKKFEDQVLQIERKLDGVVLPVYQSYSEAIRGMNEVKKLNLAPGEKTCVFVGKPDGDLPKDAVPGTVLSGKLQFAGTSAAKQAPGSSPVMFVVPPKKKESSTSKSEQKIEESIQDRLLGAKVAVLQKLSEEEEEEYNSLLKSLLEEKPNHLPVLKEEMKRSASALAKATDEEKERLQERLLSVCTTIIDSIDRDKLAVFVAKKTSPEGEEALKIKKEMETQKEALVSALGHKCRVYIDQKNSDELSKSFDLLREWVDTASDNDHLLLHARKELMEEHYGLAIKALNKLIDGEEAQKDLQEALALKQDILGELGWHCWEILEREKFRHYYPKEKLVL